MISFLYAYAKIHIYLSNEVSIPIRRFSLDNNFVLNCSEMHATGKGSYPEVEKGKYIFKKRNKKFPTGRNN